MSRDDPSTLINRIAVAYLDSRCLHAVVALGVADQLGERGASAADLAELASCDESALARIMRHLSSLGIFTMANGEFSHNDASRRLRSDDPDSMRELVGLFGLPVLWASFGDLESSVRTGRPGAESVDPGGFFAYLSAHPDELNIYDTGMTATTSRQISHLVPCFDFSPFERIADIAGGRGQLLEAVLSQVPTATGILFDRPEVLSGVAAHERVTHHPGDFFKDPLPKADCYLLKSIIHDWGDDEAAAMLRSLRAAAAPDATLLLIEHLVPDDAGPFDASNIDVYMLALVSGRERTRAEYAQLLRSAEFELVNTIPTESLSILEARPVQPT